MTRREFKAKQKRDLIKALKGVYIALGSVKASLMKIKLWSHADLEFLAKIDEEMKTAQQVLARHGVKVDGAELVWKKIQKEDAKVDDFSRSDRNDGNDSGGHRSAPEQPEDA